MSSNSEDDNTEVAVIGTPPPSKLSQDTQGRPTIGKNFYINRGKEYEDEASTLSSISGGTNISKAQFGGFAEQFESCLALRGELHGECLIDHLASAREKPPKSLAPD